MLRLRTPATRWPQPDFLPRPLRPPLLAWLWLVCGAVALGLAVDDWLALDEARGDVRRQAERWQAQVRPAAARSNVPSAATAGAVVAARSLARRFEHPWRSLFEATERRAADEVHWLRLEHDGERGDVRLEGSAPSRDAVLKTLDALAAAPGWSDVMLLRIESAGTPAAPAPGMRFELRARHGVDAVAGEREGSR